MAITVAQFAAAQLIDAEIQQIKDAIPTVQAAIASNHSVNSMTVLNDTFSTLPIYGFTLSIADSTTVLNVVLANMQTKLAALNKQLLDTGING